MKLTRTNQSIFCTVVDSENNKEYSRRYVEQLDGKPIIQWTDNRTFDFVPECFAEELERAYNRQIELKNKVVDMGLTMWLIEEATDMQYANMAITTARVTGSVGATETRSHAEKPFHDGKKEIQYAKVSRIKKVQAQ